MGGSLPCIPTIGANCPARPEPSVARSMIWDPFSTIKYGDSSVK